MRLKTECPICRTAITTQMRSIVLDSYIEKMVEQFSEDMKKRRQELVEERKGSVVHFNIILYNYYIISVCRALEILKSESVQPMKMTSSMSPFPKKK